jgi:hypothetical protein
VKPRWAVVLAVVAAIGPGASARDGDPKLPGPAVMKTLESRGFAVDPSSRATLRGTYRFPGKDPIYLSSDAGIALYVLLLRRAREDRAFAGEGVLATEASAWDAAVRAAAPGEQGRPARFVAAVFAALAGAQGLPRDDDHRADVDAQVARLLGDAAPAGKAAILDTPLDEAFGRALARNAASPEQARHDAAVFWVTRVRLPGTAAGEGARRVLVQTLPPALRDRLLGEFRWSGAALLRFPGREGVFDLAVPGDRRFLPGVLGERPEAVGLDLGARLGSPLARDLLAKAPAPVLAPAGVAPPAPGSLAASFEDVLALTLRRMDPRAPALFRSSEWDAMSLQSALAADALFRRVMGPLAAPARVFGGGDPGVFVHPDPDFWKALGGLAKGLGGELAAAAPGPFLPPRERVLEALDALDRCLTEWTPLPPEHAGTLRRFGADEFQMASLQAVGTVDLPPDKKPRSVQWVREEVLQRLRSRASSDEPWAPIDREKSPLKYRRTTAGILERLAEISGVAARAAAAQLEGGDLSPFHELSRDFGFLCEDAEGGAGGESPHGGCAVVLDDSPHRLVHGSVGLHDLWVLYPRGEARVRARGVALGFRMLVGKEWPDDAEWKRLVDRGGASVPSWASAVLDLLPAPAK